MNPIVIAVLLSLACTFSFVSAFAIDAPAPARQKKMPVRAKDNGVAALIRTDGAMVYVKPDFDADVLTQLKQGDHVRVSSGTLGDYAKFHKIRAGSVMGWIAEIDVQVAGAPKKRDHVRGLKKNQNKNVDKTQNKKDLRARADQAKKKPFVNDSQPILFTKYVGVTLGASDFVESIAGVESHETLLVYGIKVTGPDILMTGPVVDFNLSLHYGAPSYYNALSLTKPTGYLIFSDALLLYPLFHRDQGMITVGFGPLLKYSSFNITNSEGLKSLSELDVGVSLALSGALRIGKIALRLEAKSMIEKHTEKLFQVAIQQQF